LFGSFFFQDDFKLDGKVEGAFKSSSDSSIKVHFFLWVFDFNFFDGLVIEELNSLAGAGNSEKVPYFIWLFSENK
jgi:hypothetical protein